MPRCWRQNLDYDLPLVCGSPRVSIRHKNGRKEDGVGQEVFYGVSRYLLISVSALSAVMKIGAFSIPVAM